MGFITDLEKVTLDNEDFRKVLFTAKHGQIVLMSLLPGEEIGLEVHDVDQFFRFEFGAGRVIIDGVEDAVGDGFGVMVPAGSQHNVINTSAENKLKLYTIYMPPHHRDGVVHKTKAEGEADTTDHYEV